jgi:integrase
VTKTVARREQASGSITWLNKERTHARLRVYTGPDANGKPRQVSKTIRDTSPRDANRQLDDLKNAVSEGEHGGRNSTLRRVIEDYIADMPRLKRSPRTIAEAQRFLENVLPPELARRTARSLTPGEIGAFYGTLPERSVPRYHAVLRAALNRAVKHDVLVRNPADRVELAELDELPTKPLPTMAQVRDLLDAANASDERKGGLLYLALVTGMRRGELCALRWPDIDLDAGSLVVSKSIYRVGSTVGEKVPKSKKRRTVELEASVVATLKRWRLTCEQSARDAGATLAEDAFVFASFPDGTRPMNPDTISAFVYKHTGGAVHVHELRHLAATAMLANGVPANDAAEMLGHADPAFTLRVYGHATKEGQVEAARVLGNLLPPALNP